MPPCTLRRSVSESAPRERIVSLLRLSFCWALRFFIAFFHCRLDVEHTSEPRRPLLERGRSLNRAADAPASTGEANHSSHVDTCLSNDAVVGDCTRRKACAGHAEVIGLTGGADLRGCERICGWF